MITHQQIEPKNPERVVLVGTRGFIGAAVQRALRQHDIATLALTSSELNLLETGAADKLAALLKPTDVLVMLAALTPDKGRDIGTLMKNLTMAQQVCSALEKNPGAHTVYFSSDAVYPPELSRVTEESPAAPNDLYGVMHLAREIMFRGLTKIPTLVLRVTIVYGADDTHNSYGPNRFRRSARKDGKITLFGGGEETRDHVHVDDVAALTVRGMLHRSNGLLNVATGVSKSFRDVAKLVASQFPGAVEIVATPRANPVTHRHYDVTNLIKAFPDFHFMALEDGVARVHKQTMEAT
jgi:UDP-glucose 4-epimerase